MIHHDLRAIIIDKYRTQIDFALTIGESDSYVSHIVRVRRRLPPDKAEQWIEYLECDPSIITEVTR